MQIPFHNHLFLFTPVQWRGIFPFLKCAGTCKCPYSEEAAGADVTVRHLPCVRIAILVGYAVAGSLCYHPVIEPPFRIYPCLTLSIRCGLPDIYRDLHRLAAVERHKKAVLPLVDIIAVRHAAEFRLHRGERCVQPEAQLGKRNTFPLPHEIQIYAGRSIERGKMECVSSRCLTFSRGDSCLVQNPARIGLCPVLIRTCLLETDCLCDRSYSFISRSCKYQSSCPDSSHT